MEENNCLNVCTPMEVKLSPKTTYLPPFSLTSPGSSAIVSTDNTHLNTEDLCQNASNLSPSSLINLKKDEPSDSHPIEFRRTSLCEQFDPLHTPCLNSQICPKSCPVTSAGAIQPSIFSLRSANVEFSKLIASKNVSINPSEEVLISFESPKKLPKPLSPENLCVHDSKSSKRYSKDEFIQILKAQEISLQNEFSKKYHNFEAGFTEEDQQLESEISQLNKLNKYYYLILLECHGILKDISASNDEVASKTRSLEAENEELKNNIKTTKEDVSNFESVFSDVHKRYEQCKGMIKNYKDNEECLLRSIEDLQESMDEKGTMYDLLESRAQEMKVKVGQESEAMKKSAETQVVVLEAQLKKADMKIYSIERDLKQAKSDNENLGNIYDDLMSKIGI